MGNFVGYLFGHTGVAEPAYEVLYARTSSDSVMAYEIRKYGVRYAAQTIYSVQDEGSGFKDLAKYIGVFGKPENVNTKAISMTAPVVMVREPKIGAASSKIAMTAPVVKSPSTAGSGDEMMMEFFLPAEYDSYSKIPEPTSDRVTIREVPAAVGAVHRYAGSMKDGKGKEIAKGLRKQLNEDGVNVSEDHVMNNYQVWGYNPPFTLPMFRRNEIWLELSQEQVDNLINGKNANQPN